MDEREYNKQLIEKYPWLLPRNVWTDKLDDDYDYSYTILDEMPEGWRIAFGEQMCAEIQAELDKGSQEDKDSYRVLQVKEKYGLMRWYSNWTTREIEDIIWKYADLSERTCIHCGAPATKVSTIWISPWCDKCAKLDSRYEDYVPIEEYYDK